MPTLLLFRDIPLTSEETNKLPTGCFALSPEDTGFLTKKIVAQAHIKAPLPMMLKMAVSMGRAVPDAIFGYEEGFTYHSSSRAEDPKVDRAVASQSNRDGATPSRATMESKDNQYLNEYSEDSIEAVPISTG